MLAQVLLEAALPGNLTCIILVDGIIPTEDIGLTVTLPDELIVLAPGIVPAETAAERLDYPVEEMEDWYADLEAVDIRLAAMPWGVNWELELGATYDEEYGQGDFRNIPEASRQRMMD